jgi:teichuronic acid biosynthesis glycosyltransferase TuaG
MIDGLVSVVIPFYKGRKWLEEAVESVCSQSYSPIEVIVVNDGSPEDISSFLEQYKLKIKYIYQNNKGAASARNLGIEQCRGEFVAFLDSDDIWMPKKIEKQIALMKKHNAHWSHTSYTKFGNNQEEKIVDVSEYTGNIFPSCIISNPIATPSVIIKNSVFINNPEIRFAETIKYGEDTILWHQLSMKYKLLAIEEVLVKVRIRGFNAALMAYSQLKARAEIWGIVKNSRMVPKKQISMLAQIAFGYCSISFKLLNRFIKEENKYIIEVVSKLLYFWPWTLFKIEKKRLIKLRNR